MLVSKQVSHSPFVAQRRIVRGGNRLHRLSAMLTCGVVRRLSLVGCISRGRGHRSHLSRVLRLVAVPSQILLCRCIRKH